MSWQLAFQGIEAAAVVIGVVFGLAQLRQLRHQREVEAGLKLLAPLQTPESAEALLMIHDLPDNLTGDELRKRLGPQFRATLAMFRLTCMPSFIADPQCCAGESSNVT